MLNKDPGPDAARRHNVGWMLVRLFAVMALVASRLGAAQEAPGEPVTIPGAEISGWGQVGEFPARFGRPPGSTAKVPAAGGGGEKTHEPQGECHERRIKQPPHMHYS
jgi:hypothetical protein